MDRCNVSLEEVLKDFYTFRNEHGCKIDINACGKCPFKVKANELKIRDCIELFTVKPQIFLEILYPKSLEEELHEHFPKARIEGLCVCDILGIPYNICLCKKYTECKEHFALAKEEILKESLIF